MNKHENKLVTNNRGFTLIEILVSMGLVVAGMTAMVKVSDNQSKASLRIRLLAEANQIANDAYILLDNEEACRRSVIGAGANNFVQIDNNIDTLRDKDGNIVFQTDADYTRGRYLRIADIRRIPVPGYVNLAANSEFAFDIAIDIVPRLNSNIIDFSLSKVLPRRIYLQVNGAGQATECLTSVGRIFAEMKKESCESAGGTYGVVNNNRDIWCTLPGVGGANPRIDPPDNTQGFAASKDYIDDLSTPPYSNYIRTADNATTQDIVSGSVIFRGMGPGFSGIEVSPALTGTYALVNSGTMTLQDFEKAVPNFQWLQSNFREMLRYGTVGGIGSAQYCDESIGNLVMLGSSGQALCVNMSNLSCGYAPNGSPEYFNGIDSLGQAICVPIISGNTNCPQGGELIAVNGSLAFDCTASCTPSGNWVNTSIDNYSCFCDGTSRTVEKCDAECGGTCSGGAVDGDTRIVNGTCTIPPYCGAGGPGSGVTPNPSSSSSSSSGGTCGYSCSPNARFRDLCNCCPNNYPNTGANFGCCENASGTQVCL